MGYNILVTGAGSGLGASFVSTLKANGPPKCTIYAVDVKFPDGAISPNPSSSRGRGKDKEYEKASAAASVPDKPPQLGDPLAMTGGRNGMVNGDSQREDSRSRTRSPGPNGEPLPTPPPLPMDQDRPKPDRANVTRAAMVADMDRSRSATPDRQGRDPNPRVDRVATFDSTNTNESNTSAESGPSNGGANGASGKHKRERSAPINSTHPRIRHITMDLSLPSHVQRLTKLMEDKAVALNLVLHCAGVRGLNPSVDVNKPSDIKKAENYKTMDASTMNSTLNTNATGTFLLMQALVPALKRGAENAYATASADGSKPKLPKVLVMGSRMGSVSENTEEGGAYAYRASKAALNAIVKSFSVDIRDAIWVVVHPGRVETGFAGGVKEEGAMYVGHSTGEVLSLMRKLEIGDSGRFVDRFGNDIPW